MGEEEVRAIGVLAAKGSEFTRLEKNLGVIWSREKPRFARSREAHSA